jgi:hypothetical protein
MPQYLKINFSPHKKHTESPLQRPVSQGSLKKSLLFIVRIRRNTYIRSLGNIQSLILWRIRVSSVDDFSAQDTYLEQIYLLLNIIESRL